MKQLWYRLQLFIVTLVLVLTVIFAYQMIVRVNFHYDFTKDKIHSLPPEVEGLLNTLKDKPIEIILFYPKDDPQREALNVFLTQCKSKHPDFEYYFYDPVRKPQLARQYHVDTNYTIIIRAGDQEQRIVQLSEDTFTNALFRLAYPIDIHACFVTGHQELSLHDSEKSGLTQFKTDLENYNVKYDEIVLSRDGIPDICQVVFVVGPRWEFDEEEFKLLKDSFYSGTNFFYLIDPMDLGAGKKFIDFFQGFGVKIGENVLVDKVSRVVGGDFLMPIVNEYIKDHPSVRKMTQATFFPISRTVQASVDGPEELEVSPLGMTSEGSWAETDLVLLEEGKASFDVEYDIAGPLPIAVAVEGKEESFKGRMVIIGDSDFLTNGYISIAGNQNLGFELLKWLVRDHRFISVRSRNAEFQPLILNEKQRFFFISSIMVGYPLLFLILGGFYIIFRSKTS